MFKLDYTIQSPEERKALVEKIVEEQGDELTSTQLEILADYLVLCMERQERKEKKILTQNRLQTINKRETSYEGLVSSLENGEDSAYNLFKEDDKNQIFRPKISITKQDLETIPCLKELREAIEKQENALKKASGKAAFVIKQSLIEMRKMQYAIKQAYQKPISAKKMQIQSKFGKRFEDFSYLDENNDVIVKGVSLMNPDVVSAILCNYSRLYEDSWGDFDSDTWFLVMDFENVCDKALADYPYYQKIVELKIDGVSNQQIQQTLETEYNIHHSLEYISSLWRNKIPKLIATQAEKDYLEWYYRTNNLYMKKCSKCGQFKPAHNLFFSKNKTSKDRFYSICKDCRNKKPNAIKPEINS